MARVRMSREEYDRSITPESEAFFTKTLERLWEEGVPYRKALTMAVQAEKAFIVRSRKVRRDREG